MSIPLNHHFVSQVHIKNFFNYETEKIYVYDKIEKKHFFKKTTKTLFSEKNLNSRFKNGVVDHSSIEEDLNIFFEKDFRKNTQIIQALTIKKILDEEVAAAIFYFAKYGVIADLRTPRYKKHFDDTMFKGLSEITKNATPQLKADIEGMFEFRKEVTYSNIIEFSEIAEKIISVMGRLVIQIYIPRNEEDYFLLPDVAAATVRAKINEYFNPDVEEVAYIGLPLTSKIYIHFHSEKLFEKKEGLTFQIYYCKTEEVNYYNKANLDYSQSKVACESEKYLKHFIAHIN